MKISTIASVTIVGSTMAGSLMLSPVRQPVAPAAPAAQTLPSTGLPVAISRIRHGLDLEAPASPTEIYEQYVPPPAPAPAPAPAPTPVRTAWAPSPGYDDPRAHLSPDAQPELRNGGAADGARLLRSLFFSRFPVREREPGSSPRPVDQRRPALG